MELDGNRVNEICKSQILNVPERTERHKGQGRNTIQHKASDRTLRGVSPASVLPHFLYGATPSVSSSVRFPPRCSMAALRNSPKPTRMESQKRGGLLNRQYVRVLHLSSATKNPAEFRRTLLFQIYPFVCTKSVAARSKEVSCRIAPQPYVIERLYFT